jgi:hypothetical protein
MSTFRISQNGNWLLQHKFICMRALRSHSHRPGMLAPARAPRAATPRPYASSHTSPACILPPPVQPPLVPPAPCPHAPPQAPAPQPCMAPAPALAHALSTSSRAFRKSFYGGASCGCRGALLVLIGRAAAHRCPLTTWGRAHVHGASRRAPRSWQ